MISVKPPIDSLHKEVRDSEGMKAAEAEIGSSWRLGEKDGATAAAMRCYGRALFTFVHGILGPPDSQDANQELWAAFLVSLETFRGDTTFRTWAYSIAWRICNDFLRDRYRQRLHQPLSAAPTLLLAEAEIRSQSAPYLRSTIKNAVARIREQLPPEDRMLLILRVDREMEWKEIARIKVAPAQPTEQDVQCLRQRFTRIKRRIREQARKEGLTDGL